MSAGAEIERILVAWFLMNERRRLFRRLRWLLESRAYAPGWEAKR